MNWKHVTGILLAVSVGLALIADPFFWVLGIFCADEPAGREASAMYACFAGIAFIPIYVSGPCLLISIVLLRRDRRAALPWQRCRS